MCQLDTETPDHIISSCPRLLEFRDFTFGEDQKTPQKWEVKNLADYLLLIADKLENISHLPEEIYVINSQGQEIKITLDPMEAPLH